MGRFAWWRRLRGGRWGRVTGYFGGRRWVRVPDTCVERIEEDYRLAEVVPSQSNPPKGGSGTIPAEIRYGDDKTIHRTGEVNIERGQDGRVAAVWFRCRLLPFTDSRADSIREATMNEIYQKNPPPPLKAVVFDDHGLGPKDEDES